MRTFNKILMITGLLLLVFAGGFGPMSAWASPAFAENTTFAFQEQATSVPEATPTPGPKIDHSLFPMLKQEFKSGLEVTKICLSCHQEAAKELMATTHWTWSFTDPKTSALLGKRNMINNYNIGMGSNEPRCTSCHIGYGFQDKSFDFTLQENVDCLVCHDTTGTYKKFPTGAGHPVYEPTEYKGVIWNPVDLSNVAQNVGPTSLATCGSCHFYGNDDSIKHGDLDPALANPPIEVDAHMSADGANLHCTSCHKTEGHKVPGTRYAMNSTDRQSCESCHTDKPHPKQLLNDHYKRIACQTCHIPLLTRGNKATRTFWDWSKAGETGPVRKDENGNIIYDPLEGEFTWEMNAKPTYTWFNGQLSYLTLKDKIDPTSVVKINTLKGSYDDPNARIFPIRVFRAKQPYDSGNNALVVPHLYPSDLNDTDAYWKSYDWNNAITYGMQYYGENYSGQYGFVETEYSRLVNHSVAPAVDSLVCIDCHTKEGGSLDFTALGFSAEEVQRLTNFPPGLGGGSISNTPESCATCHELATENWQASGHSQKDVGCVACHQPNSAAGTHPSVPMRVDRSEYVCGICHLDHMDDWKYSKHAEVPVSCIACHEPHTQQQRLVEGKPTVCENCHHKEAADAPHSSHTGAGLKCTDCHKYTKLSTGHNFEIGPDTCLHCHGTDLHASNLLAEFKRNEPAVKQTEIASGTPLAVLENPSAAEEVGSQSPVAESASETVATEAVSGGGAVIGFPAWVGILLGILIGAGLYWLIAGKDPGEERKE